MSYAELFVQTLDEKEFKHSNVEVHEETGDEIVRLGITGDNTTVQFVVIFVKDSNIVSIRSFDLVENIKDDKYADVLMCCNQLNMEYRFTKFFISDDSSITVSTDGIIDAATAGDEVFELCVRTFQIADEVYPRIMKTVWC